MSNSASVELTSQAIAYYATMSTAAATVLGLGAALLASRAVALAERASSLALDGEQGLCRVGARLSPFGCLRVRSGHLSRLWCPELVENRSHLTTTPGRRSSLVRPCSAGVLRRVGGSSVAAIRSDHFRARNSACLSRQRGVVLPIRLAPNRLPGCPIACPVARTDFPADIALADRAVTSG